jgi:hypothetical protein
VRVGVCDAPMLAGKTAQSVAGTRRKKSHRL